MIIVTSTGIRLRNFVPLLVILIAAYGASLWFANESLSIVSTVMLSACLAIFGSVHLARSYRKKSLEPAGMIVAINFVLTVVLGFFLLRVLADFVVSQWV